MGPLCGVTIEQGSGRTGDHDSSDRLHTEKKVGKEGFDRVSRKLLELHDGPLGSVNRKALPRARHLIGNGLLKLDQPHIELEHLVGMRRAREQLDRPGATPPPEARTQSPACSFSHRGWWSRAQPRLTRPCNMAPSVPG